MQLQDNGELAARTWAEHVRSVWQTTDYTEFLKLCRRRKRLALNPPRERTIRLALIGGATLDLLPAPLEACLESLGLGVEWYVGNYNTFAPDMLDADSPLVAFRPEVVWLVNTPHNIRRWPQPGDSAAAVAELVEATCREWLHFCQQVHAHARCEVLLNTFPPPVTRPLGNLGCKLPWERATFLRRLNLLLAEQAPPYVHFNDVEALASAWGVRQWFDARYWNHARQPVSFACLIPYVHNTARIIGALFGRSAKCLVLDLDNTLWGGVVGDDGVEGIAVGEGDAVSEAFKAFQEYVLRLKQRGVMLAVCSKNDEANAQAPFLQRRDMPLKLEDFVAFKANWDPKPDNLRQIAAELNIGLDALVFVDDNPAEREHVRQRLPQVRVIELTDDPSDYPRLVDEAGWFEAVALSAEDQARTAQYQANTQRAQLAETVEDYRAYLAALEQKAVIRPFEDAWLERITQLTNKSNQFNLTTRRMSRSEYEQLLQDPDVLTACVRVADRFGDNGLISVLFGRRAGDELHIEQWLMSCRVLKRGVEQLLCNYIARECRARGIRRLHGRYIPTAKNSLVRDHYRSLGFSPLRRDADGTTHWLLDLADFRPFDVAIELIEEYP